MRLLRDADFLQDLGDDCRFIDDRAAELFLQCFASVLYALDDLLVLFLLCSLDFSDLVEHVLS